MKQKKDTLTPEQKKAIQEICNKEGNRIQHQYIRDVINRNKTN
jgi:hypothetical protein